MNINSVAQVLEFSVSFYKSYKYVLDAKCIFYIFDMYIIIFLLNLQTILSKTYDDNKTILHPHLVTLHVVVQMQAI